MGAARALTRRRVVGAGAACIVAPRAPAAQRKVHRIGVLCDEAVPYFWEQLRALGYREQVNVEYVLRGTDAGSDPARHAAQVVAAKVQLIVACSNELAAAARRATSTIPIVLLYGIAPVEAGLVASLARPGGNVTGSAAITPEVAGKSVELFKAAIPGLRRVTVLVDSRDPIVRVLQAAMERAAHDLGLALSAAEVRDAGSLRRVFAAPGPERPDGIIVTTSVWSSIADIIELAAAHRVPALYPVAPAVRAGGLMAYSPNWIPQSQKNAEIVDRILRGEHPRDIPMQQPVRYAFSINLRTARALGITIPPDVLLRATSTVE